MDRKLRVAAAVAILSILVGGVILLAPAYWRNLKLQQHLESIVSEPDVEKRPDEQLQTAVSTKAASLGIQFNPDQVRVDRTSGTLHVEARYVVHVDVPLYTVDLHFRAASGAK